MSATSNNTTNMTKESTESERYPSSTSSIEDTTSTATARPVDVPIQGECGSHTFQQQQVILFIDKVSTNSRFVKSPCTKDTARSYLEDSDYDLSTAFYQYLKANYTDMDAISKEMSIIFDTGFRLQSDLLTRDMHERLSDDGDFVMELVKNDGKALYYASERLRDDHDIVTAAVKNNHWSFQYASERLRDDHDIAMEAVVKTHGYALEYASERLRDEHDFVMAAVKNYTSALRYASERLRDDHNFIMAAVKNDGSALKHASERLRDDHDIIMAAVKNYRFALQDASERLRDDHDIVMAAVKNHGSALHYASERFWDDHDIVMAAVKNHGFTLQDASERLRDDHDIVMAAVENDGFALQYASERLRDDHDIVMAAVKDDGDALEYASERLRDDRVIVMAAVKNDGDALEYASERLQDDRVIVMASVMAAVKYDCSTLEYASERLQDDHDIVMAAVKNYGKALKYASERLRDDHDIVMASIMAVVKYSCCTFLGYASERLRDDHDIVMAAVKTYGSDLEYASERFWDDHDIVMAAVKNDGSALEYASERLRDDHDIVMAAVKNCSSEDLEHCHAFSPLEYASERLRDDHDIVLAAVKNTGDALYYASFRLWNNFISIQIEIVKKCGLQNYLLWCYGRTEHRKDPHYDQRGEYLDLPHSTEESSRRKMAVIVEAVKRFDYNTLFPRPDETIGNRDVAMEVLKLHPMKFGNIKDELVLDRNCIMTYLEYSPDAAAVLDDCPDGMTALHRIVRVATQHESALPDDFGDSISAYLRHPRGREAAFVKDDANGMTPLDILFYFAKESLDEMDFLPINSFSMLMMWWHEQIGIDLLVEDES